MRDTKLEVLFFGGTDRCTSQADNFLAYASAAANSSGGDIYFLPLEGEMLPEEASFIVRELEAEARRQLSPSPELTTALTTHNNINCVRMRIYESDLKPVKVLPEGIAYVVSQDKLKKASASELSALEKQRRLEWTSSLPVVPVNIDSVRMNLNASLPESVRTLRKSDLVAAGFLRNRTTATNALLLCMEDAPEFSAVSVRLRYSSKVFHGPVYKLTEAPLDFIIRSCNQPLPPFIKEALVNALLHRDYSIQKPIEITFMDRLLSIKSPGRLIAGIGSSPVGSARTRNPSLVWLFRELGIATGWGSGMQRILSEGAAWSPRYYETEDSFVFTFIFPEQDKEEGPLARRESIIIAYIKEHGYIRNSDGQSLLGLSESSIVKLLSAMVSKGMIQSKGERKARIYTLP